MIQIGDRAFPGVGVTDLQRTPAKDYKYQLQAEDGTLRAEVRCVRDVYSLTLGSITQADYDALYDLCNTTAEYLSVTIPDGQTDRTFDAQVELGGDALGFIEHDGTRRWDGLTLTVTAVNPREDGNA